ncbi:MAG: mannose-1-phosphate guanylyltransferase/mannose-6-phosphate isomerase [Deltaproteobacteria bacterium]|jgi:mannose-1-phosphate guanylyltransferase/mannose-6-phosphate isomerase|nr:mannose-1-phosphate guanylyltransferase/mannose-6-phosphate isomerase [Deltaproteobacteria bacterium]
MPEAKPAIQPIILSGGSGSRLWPLSRNLYPKQFVDMGGSTLFEATLKRAARLPGRLAPLVVCNNGHRFLAAELLHRLDLDKARILLEQEGRNTAPAVAAAAFAALDEHADPLLLVLASDHHIEPYAEFEAAVRRAARAAESGRIVTFGVKPLEPATGYGYIISGLELEPDVFQIERFVEKPSLDKAVELLQGGNCFWNSGMFMFRASTILAELERFAPEAHAAAAEAWKNRRQDLDFIRLDAEAFGRSPAISLDYAVMEHTDKACVTPLKAKWDDLGSWESFDAAAEHDAAGNCKIGDVLARDSENSYLHSTSRLVAGIGLKDMMVVETSDAVLVMPKGRGQEVKTLLESLKAAHRPETDRHLKVFRPWGSYETLALGATFQVKRIIVKPGAALSLQLHNHRAEHWVVVSGRAKVRLGEEEKIMLANTSLYIPFGTKHRLSNPDHLPLEIIEIQAGPYLGEDDIVRFEDNFGRE